MIRLLMVGLMVVMAYTAEAQTVPTQGAIALPSADQGALDAAVHDLCNRRVAMLGEAPTHGDGHTAVFKVALVQQLITRCHFNAIAFESGRYEFLAFDRAMRRGTATPSMIADAVGGLWKFDREFQPLVGFLFSQAASGKIRLAGLDAQLGGFGQNYSNDQMVPELTGGMPAEQARTCVADFDRHISWRYSTDHPYASTDHDRLLNCVAAMRRAAMTDADLDATTRTERITMLDNIEWAIIPDLSPDADRLQARERWLYRNFTSFTEGQPAGSKVIIWGATVHLAKRTVIRQHSGPERTFGSLVHERFGQKAFSLGFSAAGGSYRVFRKLVPIEPPSALLLEQQVMDGSHADAIYLDRRTLRHRGVIMGGAIEHVPHPFNWADVVDGVVIFREEWPTHSTRAGYS